MVAITTNPAPRHHRSAAERPVPTGPAHVGPAPLRLVPPPDGTRSRLDAVRVFALTAAAVVLVAAVGYLLSAPALGTSGAVPVQEEVHVVAAGETMWSIAGDVAPAGEAATYVERLVEVNGSATVVPGQRLRLPVP